MRLAAVFSGGKDSTFSIYKMIMGGNEITHLVTVAPKNSESYMFHVPDIKWTKYQSESMGIPQIFREVSGEKEKEVEELKQILEPLKSEIDGIVSGAIASNYQKSRIDNMCRELGIKSIAPIWGIDQETHLRNLINARFKIIITGTFADGLDENWLERELDATAIDELVELNKKYKINISGEGGEYESFVLDCPLFKKELAVERAEKHWNEKEHNGYFEIKKLSSTQKI